MLQNSDNLTELSRITDVEPLWQSIYESRAANALF